MNGTVNIQNLKGTVLDPLRITGNVVSSLQSAGVKFLPLSNIAIGNETLANITTGSTNFALGGQSLFSNTTGSNNTAIGGFNVLYSNISGSANTAIGNFAMLYNQIGGQNTAIGYYALSNTNGNYNVAIGYNAGAYTIYDGQLTDAEDCIFIGANTKGFFPFTAITNAIVIGECANSKGSNTAVWGNAQIEKHFFSGVINYTINAAPANSSATGTAGDVRFSTDAIYVCIAANTWKKVTLNSF